MPRFWCACNSCPQKSIITTRQQLHNSQWIFCQKPTLPQPQTGTTTKTNPGAQKTKLAGRFTCNLRFVFRRHCYGALLLWSPGLGQILVCLVMCLFVGLGGDCDAAGRRGGHGHVTVRTSATWIWWIWCGFIYTKCRVRGRNRQLLCHCFVFLIMFRVRVCVCACITESMCGEQWGKSVCWCDDGEVLTGWARICVRVLMRCSAAVCVAVICTADGISLICMYAYVIGWGCNLPLYLHFCGRKRNLVWGLVVPTNDCRDAIGRCFLLVFKMSGFYWFGA